jgi:hypothetical protein
MRSEVKFYCPLVQGNGFRGLPLAANQIVLVLVLVLDSKAFLACDVDLWTILKSQQVPARTPNVKMFEASISRHPRSASQIV